MEGVDRCVLTQGRDTCRPHRPIGGAKPTSTVCPGATTLFQPEPPTWTAILRRGCSSAVVDDVLTSRVTDQVMHDVINS